MKSFSLSRALTLSCLVVLALPLACGDDDDDSSGTAGTGGSAGTGGKGGNGNVAGTAGRAPQPAVGGDAAGGASGLPAGLSDQPSTLTCDALTCTSAQAGLIYYVDPCCAAGDACGLNTAFLESIGASFTETCQPLDQPGTDEGSCPAAAGMTVPLQGIDVPLDPFAGCCRPDGTCGVVVDQVSTGNGALALASLELGCVEAAPFFGGASRRCDETGVGGAGGAGAGGASIGAAGRGGEGTGGAP